jgi:death-on-curing protein
VKAPRWVPAQAVRAIHSALLFEHGGIEGIRDEGLLEAALARPRHKMAYGAPDLCDLAAAYGFGLCRDHPFADGNKRTALADIDVFLQLNGRELVATEESAVVVFRELAAGELGERGLASWIRENSGPVRIEPPAPI